MAQPTCTLDDCDRPHRARGLCSTHYNQQQPGRHRKVSMECRVCRVRVEKDIANTRAHRYCSAECREIGKRLARSVVAVRRPLPVLARAVAAQRSTEPPTRTWTAGWCAECASGYITNQPRSRYCSSACRRSCKRREWKDRANRRVPDAVRAFVYERDGGTCQLCFTPVDMDAHYLDDLAPTVDHIFCQSWTTTPDHTAPNLRLAHRLCNATRGDEGQARRAAREAA